MLLDLLFTMWKVLAPKLEPTPGIVSIIMASVQVSRVISYLPHGSRPERHRDLATDLSSDVGNRVQSSLVPRATETRLWHPCGKG